jgi:glutamine synthetase
MRRYDVVREICDYMLELGWGPYQNDHEDANGQFEMNWELTTHSTADKHSFFKFMVKSVAEKHGLRATFMPKPIEGLTGNGCHAHISVWDKAGKTNVFAAKGGSGPTGEVGLSEQGKHFLGGIMKHASALAAITNPTVNSYKRINAPRTTVRRDLGTQHRHVDRQQPHPHGACAGAGPVRAAPARWRGQSRTCCRPSSSQPASTASAPRPIPASAMTSTCMPRATR